MYCPKCGSQQSTTAQFCGECGYSFVTGKGGSSFSLPSFSIRKLLPLFILLFLGIGGFVGYKYLLPFLGSKGVAVPFYMGNIKGIVYRTDGKTPLQGAEVTITGLDDKVSTDAKGEFYFFDVSLGDKTLKIEKGGHESTEQKIKVVYGEETEFTATLPIKALSLGSKIVAERENPETHKDEVWVMDRDGNNAYFLLEGEDPEILGDGQEVIVTKSGKRYQAYIDGSGETLVGVEGTKVLGSNTQEVWSPEKSKLSPDKAKTAMVDAGDVWVLSGSDKKRITSIGDTGLSGVLWAHNNKIVYVRGSSEFKVASVNADGSGNNEFYEGKGSIYWSPDGQYFSVKKYQSYYEDTSCNYCSDERKQEVVEEERIAEEENGIWIYKTTTGEGRKITNNPQDVYYDMAWIPGTHRLVYIVRDYYDKSEVDEGMYLVNIDDANDKGKKIFSKTDRIDFKKVVWSPNQNAFITSDGYLIKFDGSAEKQITDKSAVFTFLPSGKIVYVHTSSSDEQGTWLTDENVGSVKKITNYNLSLNFSPSPDGNLLLTDGGGYIWTIDKNGENLLQITDEPGFSNPKWL